ncbi:MAG: ORF6N domain-containing protein [Treponema sp.]|nr:ORF6N domain-containing protein [Treponema sp.]MDY4131591.1 ORF6N domain-containing protein [Treponema sp.]MDY5838913.1 ORF6N domain-containing protein [Treponema sp.]
METEIIIHNENDLRNKIYTIRGVHVMLDSDLAEIYGYETKRFNEQVKHNIERFDEDFRFQLTDDEVKIVSRSKISTLNDEPQGRGHNIKYNPYAFTEQGIYMLMTVLRGELAVKQSKTLIRLFKQMKDFVLTNSQLFAEIDGIKKHLLESDLHHKENDKKIDELFTLQYPTLTLSFTSKMHDRFLIIDNSVLYHVGASLKDLGKKCFAFEILDSALIESVMKNLY